MIVDIKAVGYRIFVSDVQESIYMLKYRRVENDLIMYVDDTYIRWLTAAAIVDDYAIAIADKFGNISLVS